MSWRDGLFAALLGPLFVLLLGNLDGFAQVVRSYAARGTAEVGTASGGLATVARAAAGFAAQPALPTYDFWGPSRVIPGTINEFPFWSFLFADLHPHLIGIPFSLLFLALVLTLLLEPKGIQGSRWWRQLALAAALALMLGTLATVNLWELPTYLGLGVLAFLVSQFYGQGRIHWRLTLAFVPLYLAGAYLAYWPFFTRYVNVGASGFGLVREGDDLGLWLLIWGFFVFLVVSWLLYTASRPARPWLGEDGVRTRPTGIERAVSLGWRYFDRLPRAIYLHGRLVERPGVGYQALLWLLPAAMVAGLGALWWDRAVLALCLPLLALAFVLLWRRGRHADPGSIFVAVLTVTGFAILAGTQVFYLKDFLQGGDWYRMNTLFKFFSQVWVLWGIAAAVAMPRLWRGLVGAFGGTDGVQATTPAGLVRIVWISLFVLLLGASLAYPLLGTPARLDQRFNGWRPPLGTLNGLDFMREGVYTWPDGAHRIELRYDWAAIQWILENIAGSPVIVESAEIDYYRAGGSRVASLTGLSGLRGMHASEQRYGDEVGRRDGQHWEFWNTPDVARTLALIDELDIALIYVGQLEERQHPQGVEKLARMAEDGLLTPIYTNERVILYAVPGALRERAQGGYQPS